MSNIRYLHATLGWVDLVNPRLKMPNGSWVDLNITPRVIPSNQGGNTSPDDFVLTTTRPSRANAGIPTGTTLNTLTPALANQYGTIQAATSSACAKWIPDAGVTLTGYIIPWAIVISQPDVTLKYCKLIGPQDITGGIAVDTRNNPNMGVVTMTGNNNSLNAKIIQCDIVPSICWSGSTGIIGHHYTAERNYIADVTDAFGCYNTSGTDASTKIYGNYAERLTFYNNDPRQSNAITHNDFVQIQGGLNHDLVGNFFKAVWSPRADIPAGSSTLDPMGSGLYVANAAAGGARLFTVTPNVNTVGNVNIQYNWGLSGITYALAIPKTGIQTSSSGLGTFANNRDYGYHRVVSLGGFTEEVGIAHHVDMPWNSGWTGHTVGDKYTDNTYNNVRYPNFNDTSGSPSIIRAQNS